MEINVVADGFFHAVTWVLRSGRGRCLTLGLLLCFTGGRKHSSSAVREGSPIGSAAPPGAPVGVVDGDHTLPAADPGLLSKLLA